MVRSNVCGVRGGDYRTKRDLVSFAVVCGQLVCQQVPQPGFAAKVYTAKTYSVKERTKDDDHDDRFYIALFSAHEQTHRARM